MDGNDGPYVWVERPGDDPEDGDAADADRAHEDEFVIVEGQLTTFRDYER